MIKKLYSIVQTKKRNNKKWRITYKIYKVIINILYPIMAHFSNRIGVDDKSDVIISLTTYPARINVVWVTITSLLNQTYKPAKVILYLSKEQFPGGIDELPRKLKNLSRRGLEIEFVDEDLKPHKKYYYAFKAFKNKMVITADDDIFYPEDHIEGLVIAAKKYPDSIICYRSHEIQLTDNGSEEYNRFKPYNSWKNNKTTEPDLLTLPVGCNGVLYRPALFDDEIFNMDSIMKTSLYTDDLWLKAMEVRNDIKTYNCSKEPLVYFNNIFTMNTGLWKTNTDVNDNKNDESWEKLMNAYPEVRKKLLATFFKMNKLN